ncbi:T9SS type A sorting domain-containing protein, partial [uncultured Maribacter sp.]|uniref:T9SS type A sorting domain-containing protein n=1 Tax=uncultured Maribacter sp. TaxID=431308 RepID=UPI0026332688
ATASDEGTYTYNTPQGCAINLNVNVKSFDCNSLGLQTSYSVNNGTFVNEDTNSVFISLNEGDDLILNLNRGEIPFSISGYKTRPLSEEDFVINKAKTSDIGSYNLTTKEGCNKLLVINVQKIAITSNPKIEDIILYPNPTTDGKIKFIVKDFINETINIRFYDIYGKLVSTNLIPLNHGEEEELNIGHFNVGTYIVEIVRVEKAESIYKKIIKKN